MSDNSQPFAVQNTNSRGASATTVVPQKKQGAAGPKIRWDAAHLKNSYANVCNISLTREEVILLFGINQALQSGQKDVTVQLNDRIILSPFAPSASTQC